MVRIEGRTMLDGEKLNTVRDEIAAAFDPDSLAQLLRFKLGKILCNIVNCAKSFDNLVFDLLVRAEREGWLQVVLFEIATARREKEELIIAIRELAPNALKPITTVVLTEKVKVGLEAVIGLLKDPRVQDILTEYSAKLKRTRDGVTDLNMYKKLHDELHTLQQQLSVKLHEACEEARGGALVDDVDRVVYHLRDSVERAQDAAGQLNSEKDRKIENAWIATLKKIAELVKQGGPANPDAFERAEKMFGRVLIEASRISGKMTDLVASLNLDGLRDALVKIRDQFQDTPAGPELTLALEGLALMQPRLSGLVEEHTEWQIIDRAITAAKEWPEFTIQERFLEWSDTHSRLETLFKLSPNSPWVDCLKQQIDKMEKAGAQGDRTRFESAFDMFRTASINRFVDVDKQLLERSRTVATVAPILARLV